MKIIGMSKESRQVGFERKLELGVPQFIFTRPCTSLQ